jgi:NTF2 fold immunity protein
MKTLPALLMLLGLALCNHCALANGIGEPKHSHIPNDGFVPDAQTAVEIALAVWRPIYGSKQLQRQRPFSAVLIDGTWHVQGSLPKGYNGGTAIAEISRSDGKILRVSHGK